MKKSLRNNEEVAHVWASQTQAEGHASHFFFEGPSIFSYGRHFEVARFVKPDVVLFNESGYSNSTTQHQNHARGAVSHLKTFTVPSMTDHNANAEYLIKELADELSRISRMRKNGEFCLSAYARKAEEALDYAQMFKVQKPLLNKIAAIYAKRENPLTPEMLAKLKARAKAEREAKAKATAAKKLELQADYDGWKAGTVTTLPYQAQGLFPIALRVVGNEIQTTKGATVPVIEARKLWHMLRTDATKAIGMRVGHYTVDRIDPEQKALIIGCHTIPMSEVARLAVDLGFTKAVA